MARPWRNPRNSGLTAATPAREQDGRRVLPGCFTGSPNNRANLVSSSARPLRPIQMGGVHTHKHPALPDDPMKRLILIVLLAITGARLRLKRTPISVLRIGR
jgi:hypothetical protein